VGFFNEMYHMKLSTNKLTMRLIKCIWELKFADLYPANTMLWQCSENYAGRASLPLAVGDKDFRSKSSHLSACGKEFLCQPYIPLTKCVELGTLFSLRFLCTYIYKISLLKNDVVNFGVYPGEQFSSRQTLM
jgi:hypothetical protein